MTRVGYLGLGAMGGSLASHLIGKFDLRVFDSNRFAIEALVAKGAVAADGASDLASCCDVIVLCLPKTADVRTALFSTGGLLEGLKPGALVIDQTSGVPSETAAIASDLQLRGVHYLDAPVSGGIPAAQAGKITVIASGPDAAWEKAEVILRSISQKVFRCSARVGDGQAMKLVNNAMGAAYRIATLELVALGRRAGVGLAEIVSHLNAGRAANFTSRNMLVGLVEGRSTTNFALGLMVKDLNEALALGLANQAPLPLTSAARSLMQMGLYLLGPASKLDDVIPLVERLGGVSLRGEGKLDNKLLHEIGLACLVCNLLAVSECARLGLLYGLAANQIDIVINSGSAWSVATESVLPKVAAGKVPVLGITLGEADKCMANLSRLAAGCGLPFLLPAQALALVQSAIASHGEQADLGYLAPGKTSPP